MEHVLWSFLAFGVYVLLPIVPAIVIYWLFPKSQAFASGPLGTVTIKAGGAFAAYVITMFLAHGPYKDITAQIEAMTEPTWKLWTKVALRDSAGRPLSDDEARDVIKNLSVAIDPPLAGGAYPDISVRLPLRKPDDWPVVHLTLPGFVEQPIVLKTALDSNEAQVSGKRDIKMNLVLRQRGSAASRPYPSDDVVPEPLLDGPPIETRSVGVLVCTTPPLQRSTTPGGRPTRSLVDPCVKIQTGALP